MNEFARLPPEGKRELLARLLKERIGASGFFPLSFAQEQLWFLNQLQPDKAIHNIARSFALIGPLDAVALERAINEIVRRHGALRTSFKMVSGRPMQVVVSDVTLPLQIIDLRDVPAAERQREARRHTREETCRPFELTKAPLLRVALLRLEDEKHELLLTMHHMVFDGWSIGILFHELSTLYEAFSSGKQSPLPELPIQYPDYAIWQRERLQGPALEEQLAFWKSELADAPPVLELLTDRQRSPVQTFRGAWYHLALSPSVIDELTAVSQREGVTLFMMLFAIFGVLIQRYSERDDLVIGTPFSNRTQTETEDLIGLFVNDLVLRVDLSGDPTFRQLLARARKVALAAYAHQELPFGKLVETLRPDRDLSRNPLFQVMFALPPAQTFDLRGLTVLPTEVDFVAAPVDLALNMLQTAEGYGAFVYDAELFDEATIARMAGHYKTLLQQLVAHPDWRLSSAQMLTEAERFQILVDFNDTGLGSRPPTCIHHCFEAQAENTPDAIAVIGENARLSYAELNRRANQLAHYLRTLGVGPEIVVGLYLNRSPELVIGLLGILKAGGAYVPLEPTYPRERLRFMLEDAGASLVLTQGKHAAQLPENHPPAVYIDDKDSPINRQPDDNPVSGVTAANLAYVIYTSGSTGKPKGVTVSHGNVSNFFLGMDRSFRPTAAGTWLAVTSPSFDVSVVELLWTLSCGFQVVLPEDPLHVFTTVSPKAPSPPRAMEFSLSYFANDHGHEAGPDKYRLLIEGARFADRHGFAAVWTPERHFHSFGGLYPNPSLTAAAIAMVTQHVRIRAGSVVLPLHHPIRVAEEWSVVDNLSNGRVGISFASGWHVNDFVLAPQNYARRKEIMLRDVETVRRLWRGEVVPFKDGLGDDIEVRILPRALQAELPIWITAAASPETFRIAGQIGANVLTHLLGQSLEELADKIRVYREARRQHAHDGPGQVTLMLHAFTGEDRERVFEKVREPFAEYLRSSFDLLSTRESLAHLGISTRDLSPAEREALLAQGSDRYLRTSGLFGTPGDGVELVRRLQAVGVDEVACLIDFGVDFESVMASLEHLNTVREEVKKQSQPSASNPLPLATVTHMSCTPSLARTLMAAPQGFRALSRMEKLLLGGEALPASLATAISTTTTAEIWNVYGPTETTVYSAAYPLRRAETGSTIPIGRPIANTCYILDRHDQLAPIGVAGELLIGGAGVARGYQGKAALTAERFLPDPFSGEQGARLYKTGDRARWRPDGTIEFLGRADQQVKIRGYRIELAEVELALQGHPSVREAVVIADDDEVGDKRLVAYIVPREAAASALGLRRYLVDLLPEYMVPAHFVVLDRLPLTPNGKLDRRGLPLPQVRPFAPERAPILPETPAEQAIAGIWQRVLRLEHVDTHANFFDLGGTSLRMIEVLAGLRTIFPQEHLSLVDLFRLPTVSALADHVAGRPLNSLPAEATQGRRRPQDLTSRREMLRAHRDRVAGERIGDHG